MLSIQKLHDVILNIIVGYFILSAVGVILLALSSLTYQTSVFGFLNFLLDFITMSHIAGILSNHPFVAAVIQTVRLYDTLSIWLKDIFTVVILLTAAVYIIKRRKLGLYLGFFICIYGLIVGTTYGLRYNPIEHFQNVFGGVMIYGFNDLSWFVMAISTLITIITPFYLIANRKLFK